MFLKIRIMIGSADSTCKQLVSVVTENSGNATISSVPANAWVLAGNPYSSTIDWDLNFRR